MSLGAIDFGMIVDSAIIIVEAVVTHINTGHFSQPEVRAAYLCFNVRMRSSNPICTDPETDGRGSSFLCFPNPSECCVR